MQKLGKYEILAELGHGAMGVVYKARDPFIGRLIALKTINSNLVDRPDLLERFYQEAQSAGKLQHPNIVTIFELGQEKDTPFIAMEYLDGESLEKAIARQSDLPLAMKVGHIVRTCQALEYAHKNRVVHRDIKPGNIMVTSESIVKVVDFGIARLVDFSRTHTNMMIGTPAYMAPELFRKKKADERTDIWAVGVTFYELICHQRPFTGDGYDIIRSIMEDDFPVPSSIVPECTGEVEGVIHRMLCKAPAERYQSMEDVLLDLEPVWNRLRSDAAKQLADRAKEFYELSDLAKAQETLRRARQIDNTNLQVKGLLEKVTAELRRKEILPKVQEHLSRGRALLQSGQLREAQAEAEAALGLDSHHDPAHHLLAEVEAATARAKQLEQKLRLAKQRLAEGSLAEAESALRQALELDAANLQALDLKRQLAEEHARREKRKRLSELLHRARTLWTELQYNECLALLAEGQKEFPNEPELRTLQQRAQADQAEQRSQLQIAEVRKLLGQQKLVEARKALDVLKRERAQDSTVRNLQTLLLQEEQEQRRKERLEQQLAKLRHLVVSGKFEESLAKGEQLLREFPQESEINDLLVYVRGELAQQRQKLDEQEREEQVRSLLEAQRFREAGDAARRAFQEFPNQDSFRRLAAEADEKRKEQEEREKIQREIQQRVQEIRSKIKRQDLTDAIDLARQTLATLGPDTDVTQLLQAAEVEFGERKKKREEQQQRLASARTLVDEGDYAGATQVLDRAIATRILAQSDPQAMRLLSEIAEKEEALRQEELKQKKEEKRKAEEETKRKEAQKAAKPETKPPSPAVILDKPSGGRSSIEAVVPPPSHVSAPSLAESSTLAESPTNVASPVPKPETSVPVMTPLPAIPSKRPIIETQVRVEERIPTPPFVLAPPSPSPFKKPAVLAVVGLVLAATVSAGIYFYLHKRSVVDVKTDQRELDLQKESQDLRKQGRLDEATAKDEEIENLKGAQAEWARKDAEALGNLKQQENSLMTDAKTADDKNDYKQAEKIYQQVIDLHGAREADARAARDSVILREKGGSPETIAQGFFDRGADAFKRRDYPGAERFFQDALKQGQPNWGHRAQAQDYLKRCENRLSQQRSLREAETQFGAKQYESARNSASRAVNVQDGDAEFQQSSQALLQRIQGRELQKRDFDDGSELERNGQRDQAKAKFERVVKPPSGDPDADLVAKATEAIRRIEAYKPPTNYDAVVREIRTLISQGRLDEADSKMNTLPPNQPEYGNLKQQIASGQEDQAFTQKKGEFAQADSSKSKVALRSLRPFFMEEANKSGRHRDEARNIVIEIDADLKEPEVVKPPDVAKPANNTNSSGNGGTSSGGNDVAAINSVVQRFAKAYNEGNLGALRAVREYDPKDEKKLPEILSKAKGQGYTLRNCSVPQIAGETASISCDVVMTKIPGLKPARTNIHLKNFDGQWMIVSSN